MLHFKRKRQKSFVGQAAPKPARGAYSAPLDPPKGEGVAEEGKGRGEEEAKRKKGRGQKG